MTWHLTPDEFIHLWRETGSDRYPFPLRLRASVRWQEDQDDLTRYLATRFPTGFDPDLSAALRLAANPSIALVLTGMQRTPLRIFAAVDSTVAVSLVQHPGPTIDEGANITIEAGDPPLIPKVIAAVLGPLHAGNTPARTETRPRHAAASPDQLHQSTWYTAESTTGQGHIEVRHGLRTPNPAPPKYLSWIDIANDGRYTYRAVGRAIEVTPCSPATLIRELTHLLTPQKR